MKHTPGPWRFSSHPHYSYMRIYCSSNPDEGDNLRGYCGEANARLIAAAPELLEALREVVPVLEAALMVNGQPEPGSIGYKARAAIAKATGETP